MLNKRNIIIGIVVIMAIAGFAFFSGNKSADKQAGWTGKKELTRSIAADAIFAYIKDGYAGKAETANYDKNKQAYYGDTYSDSGFSPAYLSVYETAGLITITSRENEWGLERIYFTFTDKGWQYIKVNETSKTATVRFAEPKSVEVTGLTAPSTAGGAQTILADYTMKFKLTPFGELYEKNKKEWQLYASKPSDDQSAKIPFVLYDDGWRIAQ